MNWKHLTASKMRSVNCVYLAVRPVNPMRFVNLMITLRESVKVMKGHFVLIRELDL